MSDKDDAMLDLYVAAYREPGTAEEDWKTLKRLAADDVIKVGALSLVNRDSDGNLALLTDPWVRCGRAGLVGGRRG
jgi:uncharacterized membrane protein